jgi:membrane-associated phospholipid phosphatase
VVVIIWVVLVGLARMALDAHYPSDVLGGALGGTLALSLYVWLTRPGAWADQSSARPKDSEPARHGSRLSRRSSPSTG